MRQWQTHPGGVWSLCFSRDGTILATGGDDRRVRLWDARTGESRAEFRASGGRYACATFHPSGRTVAIGSGDRVQIRSLESGRSRKRAHVPFEGDRTRDVQTLVYSPDGRELAIGADGFVYVARPADDSIREWRMGGNNTLYLVWSRDGKWLAGSCDYGPCYVWNAASGEVQHALPHDHRNHEIDVHGIDLSPDGRYLAAAYNEGQVRLWDLRSDTVAHELEGHTHNVLQVAFHPTGKIIATASRDSTVRLWEVETGREVQCFDWELGEARRIAFAPDGLTVAAAGSQGNVVMWDVEVL